MILKYDDEIYLLVYFDGILRICINTEKIHAFADEILTGFEGRVKQTITKFLGLDHNMKDEEDLIHSASAVKRKFQKFMIE